MIKTFALSSLLSIFLLSCDKKDEIVEEEFFFYEIRDLTKAPDPVRLEEILATPIDILNVEAHVRLNMEEQRAYVRSAMTFQIGNRQGIPLFDLRQNILSASLDGVKLSPSNIFPVDLGGGEETEMLVLNVELEPYTQHTLILTYNLEKPNSPGAVPIYWDSPNTVIWNFNYSDALPGRFLGQWFPANLNYDNFSLSLDIDLNGMANRDYFIIANGEVNSINQHHWEVIFPENYASFSHLFILLPEDMMISAEEEIELNGKSVAIETHIQSDMFAVDVSFLINPYIEANLREFTTTFGNYAHDRYIAVIQDNFGGMEYDGATISSLGALRHEVFHSWFARGVRPLTGDDGWFDEAWTMFYTESAEAFDNNDSPLTLYYGNPWIRSLTNIRSIYSGGNRMFAAIAERVGREELISSMASLYQDYVLQTISTLELEKYLYCHLESPEVIRVFHRFVYGRLGEPEIPSLEYCE